MLTKLNFTGRIDLPIESMRAEIAVVGEKFSLNLGWDFQEFGFDPQYELILDIRSAGTTETRRRSLGPVGDGFGRRTLDISTMRNPSTSRLRIKVVDTAGDFRPLIAQLDNFCPTMPRDQDDAKSILKIQRDDGLDVPWKLQIDNGEPILAISGKKDLYRGLNNDASVFLPVVICELVRQIFVWRARERESDNQPAMNAWMDFFIELGCSESYFEDPDPTLTETELNQMIAEEADSLARTFAIKHDLIKEIVGVIEMKEGE